MLLGFRRFSRSRTLLVVPAVVAAATVLAWPLSAAEPDKPTNNTMQTPTTSVPPVPHAQDKPNAIPVPDGPVVERKELEGGLIVEDIVVGTGYEVKPGGAVIAHYHGTLKADPSVVFDSSFERGEPVGFPLEGVIPG